MEQILLKLPGIGCYITDILVTGKNDREHLSHLEAVLKCLKEQGLTVKKKKYHFLQLSVVYLGKVISRESIKTFKIKAKAILKVNPLTDCTQLRSFLGMVNNYSKFLKCLADLSSP